MVVDPINLSGANPTPMEPPLVQLRGVTKTFGSKRVLNGVDLDIHRGDRIAIIGPSGTGKSTILRVISGLIMPDAGTVYLQGRQRQGPIEDEDNPFRINLVFQQAALFDSLTVGENVGFYLYQNSNLPRDRIHTLVEASLDKVGLKGASPLYPSELSGGMRKRASFARAIIQDPSVQQVPGILLYDEPTAGLDPIASTVIEDLIWDLGRDTQTCSTYVVVTHQESTIRRTAERVILLYEGRVQWQGSIQEMDETSNPFVRQFFAAQVQGPIAIAP